MARYIYSARVTPSAIAGILKEGTDREAALGAMFAAAGANLERYFFSTDTAEVVLVYTAEAAARLDSLFLSVAASGIADNASWSNRRVLTGAELAELARNTSAGVYRAPGAA